MNPASIPEYSEITSPAPAAPRGKPARPSQDFHVEVCSSCHPFYTTESRESSIPPGASRNSGQRYKGKSAAKVIPDKSVDAAK